MMRRTQREVDLGLSPGFSDIMHQRMQPHLQKVCTGYQCHLLILGLLPANIGATKVTKERLMTFKTDVVSLLPSQRAVGITWTQEEVGNYVLTPCSPTEYFSLPLSLTEMVSM